ncbi:geranylgeranyl diphosphate synthase type II [Roseiarcus fermentans]|uniref:Geranylgeranyl diphosphate synthase type II n=1 Tax=Roseiarcus fermentans TaxID=1473586 RepID=A0A366EKH8_9HYPH|nr:polyprenyl synthetase family protein [Roseiarcus fermentans]RBP02901.1 geranylgeranyl diphosphate synthase type II [Roseiarcus fermentans]
MLTSDRIELALESAVHRAGDAGSPPLLASALHYAVFPGGHRIRPNLCIAVAAACGAPFPRETYAAAAAVELLHCASLVHDDLPSFDNADTRRGKPSVHAQFGEPIAVLTGDALIVLAFETLAREVAPSRLAPAIAIVAGAVGAPGGIVAGQAWECEAAVPLADYQRAKTGALFVGATMSGAASAGVDPEPWRMLGDKIGEAYQVADDLRDVLCTAEELGKPIGQDAARTRPNAAAQLGIAGAKSRLETLVAAASASIPDCPGRAALCKAIELQTRALFPRQLTQVAA